MKQRIEVLAAYLGKRLSEPSTWQGLGFLATLLGARLTEMEITQGLALAAGFSAVLKILLPDSIEVEASEIETSTTVATNSKELP